MRYLIAILITLFCTIWLIFGLWISYYSYDVYIGQHLRLADDASVAGVKLDYLNQYKSAIKERILRNDARYFFTRDRLTRDTQLKIIDTLISRLSDMSQMDTKSFEYQQALLQVTGQEFDHTMTEINSVIHSCWIRQSIFVFCGLYLSWLVWLLGMIANINWVTVIEFALLL